MSSRSPSPRRSPPRDRSRSPARASGNDGAAEAKSDSTRDPAPTTSSNGGGSSSSGRGSGSGYGAGYPYGQSSCDQPQGKRIFVGGLSVDTRASDLENAFSKFAPIKCDLKNGYGFLEFAEARDAEDAIKAMDGEKIDGRKIQVEMAKGKNRTASGPFRGPPQGGARPGGWRVEVEGLDSRTSWQDLKDFARDGGSLRVAYTDVKNDSRGDRIGIIEYMSREDMQRALRNLDDTRCGSSYVRLYEQKSSYPPPSSSYRSRSRSPPRRGRSRSRSPPRRGDSRSPPRRRY